MTHRVIEQLHAYGHHVDQAAPVLTLDEVERRAAPAPPLQVPDRRRLPGWAIATAAALVLLVAVGGLSMALGGSESSGPPADIATTTSVPVSMTTVPVDSSPTVTPIPLTAFETLPPQGAWNPVLADTIAKDEPPPATCPAGTDPDTPGPADQVRPIARWTNNLAAAFDRRTGNIIYVDVVARTWLFDVCTNTWQKANAEEIPTTPSIVEAPSPGPLVYDLDSDLTVMMGLGNLAVYDSTRNTWERRNTPAITGDDGLLDPGFPLGAVYDPLSGLIVTTYQSGDDPEAWDLWAYDVDTDTWTEVGAITIDRTTPCCTGIDLLGYSSAIDRLILTTYIDNAPVTLLVDPRTGDMTIVPDDRSPVVNLVWPDLSFGQANDTVYVYGPRIDGGFVGFDPTTLSWNPHTPPDDVPLPEGIPLRPSAFAAIVDDPINGRVLLINGVRGEWWGQASNEIWTFHPSTGQWRFLHTPPGSQD